MTAQQMIELNNTKIESKRLELIEAIKKIGKATTPNEFRQINLVVGNIQNDMAKLFNENELINQLNKN